MDDWTQRLAEWGRNFAYLVPATIGGLIDYLNQIQRGDKKWSLLGFSVHMMGALFFGWMAGTLVSELGYTANAIAACGGMGGFLGVRLADLIVHRFFRVERRTP